MQSGSSIFLIVNLARSWLHLYFLKILFSKNRYLSQRSLFYYPSVHKTKEYAFSAYGNRQILIQLLHYFFFCATSDTEQFCLIIYLSKFFLNRLATHGLVDTTSKLVKHVRANFMLSIKCFPR